jgi:hypothetical protein
MGKVYNVFVSVKDDLFKLIAVNGSFSFTEDEAYKVVESLTAVDFFTFQGVSDEAEGRSVYMGVNSAMKQHTVVFHREAS